MKRHLVNKAKTIIKLDQESHQNENIFISFNQDTNTVDDVHNVSIQYNYTASSDEDNYSEDEIRLWNLDEKLKSERYNTQFLVNLNSKGFSIKYFQENGFEYPLCFQDKDGLGLKVPSDDFTVSDIKRCVGSKRIVDVVDVNTQKGLTMSMKDWCHYYENDRQGRLLNVISLEFSHTKLERYVEAPEVVRQMDWVNLAWPPNLIASHTESTNLLDKMKYPKVQKYVLMSVAKCYTDFHIDMGGTSVWYHVLKGEKIFWLIPPTEENLKSYEKWIKSGRQNIQFFGDMVSDCQRVTLKKGHTFMLPSGWIHSVYTPRDSIVFGGNFLHSLNIPMQLTIFNIENKLRVPQKFRYPFFIEMIWYVIERFVYYASGNLYLRDDQPLETTTEGYKYEYKLKDLNVLLNDYDSAIGLYNFLKYLSPSKRQVPINIEKPEELLKRFKQTLSQKFNDDLTNFNNGASSMVTRSATQHQGIKDNQYFTTASVKFIPKNYKSLLNTSIQIKPKPNENQYNKNASNNDPYLFDKSENETFLNYSLSRAEPTTRKYNMRKLQRTKGSIKKRLRPSFILRTNIERRRRIRCRVCEPCIRDDCGECKYCKDMKKFGGQGISKQCCLKKQCVKPLLPSTTNCMYCAIQIDRYNANSNTTMYECESCFEIYHAQCFWKRYPHLLEVECVINESLPSSWHCAKCIQNGFSTIDDNDQGIDLEHTYDETFDDQLMHTDDTLSNASLASIHSLTYSEKQIILNEFCEIVTENRNEYLVFGTSQIHENKNQNSYQDFNKFKSKNKIKAEENLKRNFNDVSNKITPLIIHNEGCKLELIKVGSNQTKSALESNTSNWNNSIQEISLNNLYSTPVSSASSVSCSLNVSSDYYEDRSFLCSNYDLNETNHDCSGIDDRDADEYAIDDDHLQNDAEVLANCDDLLWKPCVNN